MKQITRRELLRRLAAGSALAAWPSLARAASSLQTRRSEAPFQRVNVLFHGFSVLQFGGEEVHVYLPDGGPDRAYLAGTWLQEVALERGAEYRFSGVVTGPRPAFYQIDPRQNAIFSNRAIDNKLSYCRLVLPFPDVVTPLRLLHEKHGKHFFTGTPRPVIRNKAIPQILAFTYLHPDTRSPLQFRPLPWTPVILGGVVNLHVWNASAKTPAPAASLRGFTVMAKLIGAPELGLNRVYDRIKPPRPDRKPELVGMGCQEEWSLVERLSEPEGCGRHEKYDPKHDTGLDALPLILF